MIKLKGNIVGKDENTTITKTQGKWQKALGPLRFILAFGLFAFAGCGPKNTGDLIGVQGRGLWFHPQPFELRQCYQYLPQSFRWWQVR